MTLRPTPELAAKHRIVAPQMDAAAFRPGWRIESRLHGLFSAGAITREGLDAGRRWRRDWEAALERSRSSTAQLTAIRSNNGSGSGPAPRLAALARLRAAEAALGTFAARLLQLCLARDLAWTQIGRVCRCTDKTAARWTATAIAALAMHYRIADRERPGRNSGPGAPSGGWPEG